MTTKAKRQIGNGLCLVENPDGFFFDYEYLSEEQILFREQMYLLQHENEIITATLSGPAEVVVNHTQSLIMFVHNLSVSQ